MTDYAKERFLSATAGHKINVLLDNGLYKHLRFENQNDSCYWFDITTWPNYLCISGDMGCFTFSRIEDMFGFFRRKKLSIEAYYWAGKLQIGAGGNHRNVCERWSQDLFEKNIREYVSCNISDLSLSEAKEIWQQVKNEILCSEDKYDSVAAVRNFHNKHIDFSNFFEYNCEEYEFHYLWCCYAIVWGIQKYDEFKEKHND